MRRPPTGCGRQHLSWLGALWSSPNTLLGLAFALLSGARPRWRGGLLIARADAGVARLLLTRRGFGAITFGRVVVSAVPLTPSLLRHEEHHARQYEVLGPYFLPLYLWQHARRGYAGNPLEREAAACAAAWDLRQEARRPPTPGGCGERWCRPGGWRAAPRAPSPTARRSL